MAALPPESNDPVDVAAAIEDHVFNEFSNTDNKYKNRVRSRVQNLKDGKNPKLRENVLMGYISADRIATMTAEVNFNRFFFPLPKIFPSKFNQICTTKLIAFNFHDNRKTKKF